MKIDLHCHTEVSADCMTPLDLIPVKCLEQGIRVQAITDHDEVRGAQELQETVENDPDLELVIIVGEEILTDQGEIIGLYLQERIEPGLSPSETVHQIHEQGGLVLLPHGFDPLKRLRLDPVAREEIAHNIDIVETYNARISRPRWNDAAAEWAEERDLPMSAGSDAHLLRDIGAAWQDVPFQLVNTPQDLLHCIRQGVPTGKWTHPVKAYVQKQWHHLKNRLGLS